jgi:hypothetical protein
MKNQLFIFLAMALFVVGCKKKDPPTITTKPITQITSNGAKLGMSLDSKGNLISECGIVYSTNPSPTVSDKIIIMPSTAGYDTITGLQNGYEHLLTPNTTYYVRSYVKYTSNKFSSTEKIEYGEEISFTTLSIGGTGPGGGVIFYNKGNTDGGWQYLEAASTTSQGTTFYWGCNGTLISGTNTDVGSGESNTNSINANCTDQSKAATLCANFSQGGQNDWFLPSIDELNVLSKNFSTLSSGVYWSSSEYDAQYVHTFIQFSFSSSGTDLKGKTYSPNLNYIPIRAF